MISLGAFLFLLDRLIFFVCLVLIGDVTLWTLPVILFSLETLASTPTLKLVFWLVMTLCVRTTREEKKRGGDRQ